MTYAERKDREGLPGNRRGRPHGYAEPVTIMTVSLDPSTKRLIDEAAKNAGRSRSSWVRGVLMDFIAAKLKEAAEVDLMPEDEGYDPTHGGRFRVAWIESGSWECPNCKTQPVGGWLECPGCKLTRPESTYPKDLK